MNKFQLDFAQLSF